MLYLTHCLAFTFPPTPACSWSSKSTAASMVSSCPTCLAACRQAALPPRGRAWGQAAQGSSDSLLAAVQVCRAVRGGGGVDGMWVGVTVQVCVYV